VLAVLVVLYLLEVTAELQFTEWYLQVVEVVVAELLLHLLEQ
jgi:hypothetical protein